jgi:hypothetical protein
MDGAGGGHSVISPAKATDYLPPAEDVDLIEGETANDN